MATWPLLPGSLTLAVAVGVVAGGLGWALLGGIERTRRDFERLAAPSLRLGLGGLLVGLISVAVPQVWGNGYSVVSHLLSVDSPWQWVAMILLAKVLATLLSAGSGAIGGVLTPSLLVGAGTGYLCGLAGDLLFPATLGGPHAAAVTGMAAMLAAVTHAPLTAIVMVLEMTGQYQLTLPVMVACGLAHAVSAGFGTRPLYGNPIEGRP
jgi:CIC family chloride channel protein